MVAPRGPCMVSWGGHVWLLQEGGACVVAPGGGACMVAAGGVCVVAPGGGACMGYDEIQKYDQ